MPTFFGISMIAIVKTGGKQYKVKIGQVLKVEKLKGKKGDDISLNNVLTISDDSNQIIGNPSVKGASIKAKILEQTRGKKIIVFKKRRRKNYQSTRGHRQYLTVLKIKSITHDKSGISSKKTEVKNFKKKKLIED